MSAALFDVVIPTRGRASLARLLQVLAQGKGPRPGCVVVVDDRAQPRAALALGGLPSLFAERVCVLRSGARGFAAARNVGWRACGARWVAFLGESTLPGPEWLEQLHADLTGLDAEVAGSQGRILVPLPRGREPTDEERKVIALESAPWIAADMAYRRRVLLELGGFDERCRGDSREDRELALRVLTRGDCLVRGNRRTLQPIGERRPWLSVAAQCGNADDVLVAALHGARWRQRSGAPASRLGRDVGLAAAALASGAALLLGRRRAAWVAALAWTAGTAALAAERLRPGPREWREIVGVAWTSAVIPPLAVFHHLRGRLRVAGLRWRGALAWPGELGAPAAEPLELVLHGREGAGDRS